MFPSLSQLVIHLQDFLGHWER